MTRFRLDGLLGARPTAVALAVVAVACGSEGPPSSGPVDASIGGGRDGAAATASGGGGGAGAQGGEGGAASGGGGASSGGEGGSAADASPGDGGIEMLGAIPMQLSNTGLFSDMVTEELGEGVMPFAPRFVLWTDGATKRRWLYLPPGATIDATDPDGWVFPVGTKVWKEFTRDGVRVETRLMQKIGEGLGGWRFVAYIWDPATGDAVAAPDGRANAGGTPHDVPNQSACFACHSGSPDMLLGVSVVQLAHDAAGLSPTEAAALGVTLASLDAAGRLVPPPASPLAPLPGSSVAQDALGVLHTNCGHCHRPAALAWERVKMDLHLDPTRLGALEDTGVYQTAVGAGTSRLLAGVDARVSPGRPGASAVYVRMTSRVDTLGMPTIGTEDVDTVGAQKVFDWIAAMPMPDGGGGDAGDAGDNADAGDAALTDGG